MRSVPIEGAVKETFKCTVCTKEYSRLEYLRRHARTHDDVRPFRCEHCPKSFARSDVLRRHRVKCHPELLDPSEVNAAAASKPPRLPNAAPAPRGMKRSAGDGSPDSQDENDDLSPQDGFRRPDKQRRIDGGYRSGSGSSDGGHYEDPDRRSGSAYLGTGEDGYGIGQFGEGGSGRGYQPYGEPMRYGFSEEFNAAANGLGHPVSTSRSFYDKNDGPAFPIPAPGMTSAQFLESLNTGQGDAGFPQLNLPFTPITSNPFASNPAMTYPTYPQANTLNVLTPGSGSGSNSGSSHHGRSQPAVAAAGTSRTPATAFPTRPQFQSQVSMEDAANLLSMAFGPTYDGLELGQVAALTGRGITSAHETLVTAAPVITQTINQPHRLSGSGPEMVPDWNITKTTDLKKSTSGDLTMTAPSNWSFGSCYGLETTLGGGGGSNWPGAGFGMSSGLTPMDEWPSFSPGFMTAASSPQNFNALFNLGPDLDDSAADDYDSNQGLQHLPGSAAQLSNHNPERPLLRIQSSELVERFGVPLEEQDKFYMPPERMQGCYTVPHWNMPPFRTLKRVAEQTVSGLLIHLPIVHLPSFKLKDLPISLAFAICITGTPKNSAVSRDSIMDVEAKTEELDRADWFLGQGVIRPEGPDTGGASIEEIQESQTEEERKFDESKKMITNEKAGMIAQIMARAKGPGLTEYNVGSLESLIVLACPLLLSADIIQRAVGYMRLNTIINITRKIGLLSLDATHVHLYRSSEEEQGTFGRGLASIEDQWKEWIRDESRRRLVFIIYLFDTLCSVETGTPCLLTTREVAHLPLPAPDSMWHAKTSEAWANALQGYMPITLERALQLHFALDPSTGGVPDPDRSIFPRDELCLLNQSYLGMFSRMMTMISLLRGLIDLGHGKGGTCGTWGSISSLWQKPGAAGGSFRSVPKPEWTMKEVVAFYGVSLHRWRRGWDFDPSCGMSSGGPTPPPAPYHPSPFYPSPATESPGASHSLSNASPREMDGRRSTSQSSSKPESSSKSGRANSKDAEPIRNHRGELLLYEEALPFYWLAQALHSILAQDASISIKQGTPNGRGYFAPNPMTVDRFNGIDLRKMLLSARVFTRLGEGVSTAL